MSCLMHHLGGAAGAIAVAGDDDVEALERLVTLHTLSVDIGLGNDLTVVQIVPLLDDTGADAGAAAGRLGTHTAAVTALGSTQVRGIDDR